MARETSLGATLMKSAYLTAAALAVIAAAVPAHAQDAAPVDPDLRCAAWALIASAQEEDDNRQRGLGFVMSWFMGRYEARTGGKVDEQINPKTMGAILGQVDEANALCAPLAQDFGHRFGLTVEGMNEPPPSNPQAGEGR